MLKTKPVLGFPVGFAISSLILKVRITMLVETWYPCNVWIHVRRCYGEFFVGMQFQIFEVSVLRFDLWFLRESVFSICYYYGYDCLIACVMALEGVTKRTEHHGYSIGIYLQEKKMVTRTQDGELMWQYPLGPPIHQLLRNHFNSWPVIIQWFR